MPEKVFSGRTGNTVVGVVFALDSFLAARFARQRLMSKEIVAQ